MSTAPTMSKPTPQPGHASSMRPGAPSGAGGGGGAPGLVTLDPVRLLRRYWPLLMIAGIVGGALGVGAHFILAKFAPSYTSSVLFVVEPPVGRTTDIGTGTYGTMEFERFTGTQVAQMTSDAVLQSVVNTPAVMNTEWSKQFFRGGSYQPNDAAQGLSKSISASPMSMTNLIKLSMSYRKAEDTAVIANEVAKAYLQDLQRYTRSTSGEKRTALGQRQTQVEDELRRARASVTQLIEGGNVTTLREELSQEDIRMRDINSSLIELNKTRSLFRSLLDKGERELSKAQAIVYSPDIEQRADKHPIVADMTMQIANMKVDLRSLRERGYGEDHPSVLQIKDRIRASEIELEKKRQEVLKQEFTAQLDDYRTQLKAVDDQETKLLADLKDTNKRKEDLLRIRLQKEKLDEDIARLTVEQTDIKRAVQELETLANQSAFDRVKIARSAQTPTSMSFPKLKLLLPLGVFLMGGLVGGLVVLRELLDQRVRGPADLALIPRLSVLGMVPEVGEDPARPKAVETTFRDNPTGVVTESFRQIRSLLAKRMTQVGAKSLVVIGGMPGSGASTVVANVGMALAGLDERVLIIDGNLRRPSLHKSFGVNEGPGLGEVLSGLATFESAIQQTGVPNVSILSAGAAANRALPEKLGSEAMARVLAEAAGRYDRIIVDSAPAIVSGDGLALANRCDAVTLVVKALSEKRGMVNRLRSSIGETRAEFMGVIVNAVRSSAGGYFRKNIETAHKYHDGRK